MLERLGEVVDSVRIPKAALGWQIPELESAAIRMMQGDEGRDVDSDDEFDA